MAMAWAPVNSPLPEVNLGSTMAVPVSSAIIDKIGLPRPWGPLGSQGIEYNYSYDSLTNYATGWLTCGRKFACIHVVHASAIALENEIDTYEELIIVRARVRGTLVVPLIRATCRSPPCRSPSRSWKRSLNSSCSERTLRSCDSHHLGRADRAPGADRAGPGGGDQGNRQARQGSAGWRIDPGRDLHDWPLSAARAGAPVDRAHAADAADDQREHDRQAAGDAAHRRDRLRHRGRALPRHGPGHGAAV
ncbi:hypothetical protein FQA39_LY18650 [Lamprigera yunnana]|nr:hypothetical protein FQA39_LY18650 [Lamprigera yunnana]